MLIAGIHPKLKMQEDFVKFGVEKFTYNILAKIEDKNRRFAHERALIKKAIADGNCYNNTPTRKLLGPKPEKTKFGKWIYKSGFYKDAVANKIGMRPSKLSRILKSKILPTLHEAHAIEKLTQGHIKMKDWVIPK